VTALQEWDMNLLLFFLPDFFYPTCRGLACPQMIKILRNLALILFLLYLLYLVKSALGINLSDRYSAWAIFKLPIQPILDARSHPV
jgi:hypothetical protein